MADDVEWEDEKSERRKRAEKKAAELKRIEEEQATRKRPEKVIALPSKMPKKEEPVIEWEEEQASKKKLRVAKTQKQEVDEEEGVEESKEEEEKAGSKEAYYEYKLEKEKEAAAKAEEEEDKEKEKLTRREAAKAGLWGTKEERYQKSRDRWARFGHGLRRFLWFLLIFGIIAAFVLLFVLPRAEGTFIYSLLGSEVVGAESEISNIVRPAEGYINTIKQTLTMGPSEAWNADEINSEMIVNEDAGVAPSKLGPPKKHFYANSAGEKDGDEIVIEGFLKAVGTFEEDNRVNLTLGVFGDEDSPLKDGWTCTLLGIEGENSFSLLNTRNTKFSCVHDPLDRAALGGLYEEKQFKTFEVKFALGHKTRAKVFKKIIVTTADYFLGIDDPAEYFGIDPSTLRAKRASDKKTIDFSMGLAYAVEEGFVDKLFGGGESSKESFIAAAPEEYTSAYNNYLGVAVMPKGVGQLKANKLELVIPSETSIHILKGDFKVPCETFFRGESYPKLQKCTVSASHLEKIEAGKSDVYYLKFYVSEDYLGASKWRSLLATSEIDYTYYYEESTTVTVKEQPIE